MKAAICVETRRCAYKYHKPELWNILFIRGVRESSNDQYSLPFKHILNSACRQSPRIKNCCTENRMYSSHRSILLPSRSSTQHCGLHVPDIVRFTSTEMMVDSSMTSLYEPAPLNEPGLTKPTLSDSTPFFDISRSPQYVPTSVIAKNKHTHT